jgi:ribosomal protein S18 acetylase RimI-like enzyme
MLEWQYQPWAVHEAPGVRIRKMEESDLKEVERTDAASFPPLWQNPVETLRRGFAQALFATVAENENGIVGYQISTGGRSRSHLARLAVHPSVQGHGVGRALLSDLFMQLYKYGIPRLSVNTQSDNQVSLSLYKKMGFLLTGEQYPVYTFNVPAYS